MKISLQEDPMTVSNNIKFIYSKYSKVFLYFSDRGLCISYVNWKGTRKEKVLSELAS